ncbi:hypothetical protein TRAPUB_3787 [Trametes pubescens]|uniref:Uncharacterized protein n=1 Tax=Trametes pubescens TaxID=154538 RepID=A0A1M2VCU3_TRAPU|nr:hypothetical protein TRAPUB_3787 [Trametes pubescens]
MVQYEFFGTRPYGARHWSEDAVQNYVVYSHGSPFECFKRTWSNGGVCKRHWRALFKKQVFPMLFNPQPMVAPLGQPVSTGMSGRALDEEAL